MFTATSPSGRTVSLLMSTDHAYIDAQAHWYCPVCQERLQLKKGHKRRPHFSHLAHSKCPSSHAESQRHLEGKAVLYQWLREQGADVQLEVFLPASQQRADILVKTKSGTFAIEYQCSAVSREQIRARTEDYRALGIQVIWVLPYERLRRKGKTLHLQTWEWEATWHAEGDLRLFYLQAPSRLWEAHLNAYLSPQKAHAHFATHPLTSSTLEKILAHKSTLTQDPTQRQALLAYKENCRYGKRPPLTPFSTIVQERLLRHKMPIHLHPSEAGWFLPCQTWVSESPLLWQSWLYVQLLQHFEQQTFISRQTLQADEHELANDLQLPIERVQLLVEEYLRLLVRLRVLLWHPDDTFSLFRISHFPGSADEGFAMDQRYAEAACFQITSVALGS
ncbi:competence protein CoiA [Natribacillus halophilus]|uniref:Competence protein CoiA-like family, contains a predicted nuclease domain n=1 Tax=Natribacillus halophilus TaxID=549003 RepID=A0A1G8LFS0_9BACI|nr:competence protein CoiA family protein [Natribacillus halophilus]SDI54511.1 Competence protein CoiA-like family, contains a predicted nuclease domain [Natribacillus halophilus]